MPRIKISVKKKRKNPIPKGKKGKYYRSAAAGTVLTGVSAAGAGLAGVSAHSLKYRHHGDYDIGGLFEAAGIASGSAVSLGAGYAAKRKFQDAAQIRKVGPASSGLFNAGQQPQHYARRKR